MNRSQKRALVAKQGNGNLGFIRRSLASRSWEVIYSLPSALMRPNVDYCVHIWAPQYKRDMDIPESPAKGH